MNGLGAPLRYGGLAALIVMCLGLLMIAMFNIVRVERQMQIAATENMIWIFGQTQIEALSLAAALSENAGDAEVQRRFDLLVSRLNLLRDGPQWRFLQEAGLADGLQGWRDSLLALDPAQDSDRAALAAHTTALTTALRGKASRVMAREWQLQADRLDRLRQLHLLALPAIFGALLSGAGLAALLVDRERRLARTARLQGDLDRERAASEGYRRFADLMAHQVRTPLAVIDSAMHRLTRSGTPPSRQEIRNKADVSREAVARLVRLTDTAMLMARVDRGAVAPVLASHDLDRIAAATLDEVAARPADAGRVRCCPSNRPVPALCDPVLTHEILANLLGNALLYARRDGSIEMCARCDGETALCDVRDPGPGMSTEDLRRAFDNFARGTQHRDLPGSGLGLPLARHLARLQGGDVMLLPQADGGLIARLTLPRGVAA